MAFLLALGRMVHAESLPVVTDVDLQPLAAQVHRVVEALEVLGQPLSAQEKARIQQAVESASARNAVRLLQEVLDPHCLIGIEINPESRVKSVQGPAPRGSCRTAGRCS